MIRLFGKNTSQDKLIIESVRKGKEYVVFKGVRGNVHIVPEEKLDQIIKNRLDKIRTIMSAYEDMLVKAGNGYEHYAGRGAISNAMKEAGLIKEI